MLSPIALLAAVFLTFTLVRAIADWDEMKWGSGTTVAAKYMRDAYPQCERFPKDPRAAYRCALQKQSEDHDRTGWFWTEGDVEGGLWNRAMENDVAADGNRWDEEAWGTGMTAAARFLRAQFLACDEQFPGNPRAAYECALKKHRAAG